jgi:hypothetical protein
MNRPLGCPVAWLIHDPELGFPTSVAACEWCDNEMVVVEILKIGTPIPITSQRYVRFYHAECSHEWDEWLDDDDFSNL